MEFATVKDATACIDELQGFKVEPTVSLNITYGSAVGAEQAQTANGEANGMASPMKLTSPDKTRDDGDGGALVGAGGGF